MSCRCSRVIRIGRPLLLGCLPNVPKTSQMTSLPSSQSRMVSPSWSWYSFSVLNVQNPLWHVWLQLKYVASFQLLFQFAHFRLQFLDAGF